MTARDRIQKSIDEHDAAVERIRIEIDALIGEGFPNCGEAYNRTKSVIALSGAILSRLAQRKQAAEILKLLNFHLSKQAEPNTIGI